MFYGGVLLQVLHYIGIVKPSKWLKSLLLMDVEVFIGKTNF